MEKKKKKNYYKCNKCNCIFCSQCPQLKIENLAKCPSCGESAGNYFQGSESNQITFNCLKCGTKKEKENYYICNKCNCIFCIQCPYLKYENLAQCPSCGHSAGKKFQGSGSNQIAFNCLKCGTKKEKENYYKCNKCNCIFCNECPYFKNDILAESHSCDKPSRENDETYGNVAGCLWEPNFNEQIN